MSTTRAYCNGKRMSTAKPWNGKFLQVYPEQAVFENETEWRDFWTRRFEQSIRFDVENSSSFRTLFVAGASEPNPDTATRYAPLPPPLPLSPVTSSASSTAGVVVKQSPSSKGWSYRHELTYTAPPGTYYIGDLCYALYEIIYDNVFGGHGYDAGFYSKGKSFFMVDGTAYGDGDYLGSDNNHYLVDAGIIGICSEDLIDPNNRSVNGGKIHTFNQPVVIRFRGGVFHFTSGYTHITINTVGDDEDDYEEA